MCLDLLDTLVAQKSIGPVPVRTVDPLHVYPVNRSVGAFQRTIGAQTVMSSPEMRYDRRNSI